MKTLLTLLFTILVLFCNAQKMNIKINSINVSKGGYIMLSFFNSYDNFLDDEAVILKQRKPVKSETTSFIIDSLPLGAYSISVAHDEDSNGELNANFIGIPTEGWGFSTNPKLKGPPTWDKTKFDFKEDGQEIEINMNY